MSGGASKSTFSPQIFHTDDSPYYRIQYNVFHEWFACPTSDSQNLTLRHRYWHPKARPEDFGDDWSDYIPIRDMSLPEKVLEISYYKKWLQAAMEAFRNGYAKAGLKRLHRIIDAFGSPTANRRHLSLLGVDLRPTEQKNSFVYVNRYGEGNKPGIDFEICTYRDGDENAGSDSTESASDSREEGLPRRSPQASARPSGRSRPRSTPASGRAARRKRTETPFTSASEDHDRSERSRRRQGRRGPSLLDLEERWRSLEQRQREWEMRLLNERYDQMEQHVFDLQRQMRRMEMRSQANEAQDKSNTRSVEHARGRIEQLVKSDKRMRDKVRRLEETVRYLQNQINYAAHAPPHPQYPPAQPYNVQQYPPQGRQTQQTVPAGGTTNA